MISATAYEESNSPAQIRCDVFHRREHGHTGVAHRHRSQLSLKPGYNGTAARETVGLVDRSSAIRSVGARDRDPGMTTESILRISITAMVLFLVIAAAAAQTTSKPLYIDGVLRVVATFHRISEGSLPVNGSMERFGTNVYPSWPRDAQRTPTILQSIDAEVQRMERANVFFNGAGPAKHIRLVRAGRRKMSAAGQERRLRRQQRKR
jgi:hypothetical protein